MFVCCECCVLSGRRLCDELITRPEESYRLSCVVVCDLETSRIGAPYIYDISSLRVNDLTLILLTWRKWWTPNNATKWQMGFNSAFKGLNRTGAQQYNHYIQHGDNKNCYVTLRYVEDVTVIVLFLSFLYSWRATKIPNRVPEKRLQKADAYKWCQIIAVVLSIRQSL